MYPIHQLNTAFTEDGQSFHFPMIWCWAEIDCSCNYVDSKKHWDLWTPEVIDARKLFKFQCPEKSSCRLWAWYTIENFQGVCNISNTSWLTWSMPAFWLKFCSKRNNPPKSSWFRCLRSTTVFRAIPQNCHEVSAVNANRGLRPPSEFCCIY